MIKYKETVPILIINTSFLTNHQSFFYHDYVFINVFYYKLNIIVKVPLTIT